MKSDLCIPEYVQKMVAATNGRMYCGLLGRLEEYPIPDLPFETTKSPGCFLDIGCGWGRWMIAAARKGYLPIGLDLKLEAAKATRQVLKDNQMKGYVVVGDLKKLPFKENSFETVWSYSVVQHVHRSWAEQCFNEMARVLKEKGFCFLEFPNKAGVWNRLVQWRRNENEEDEKSWCVRYYDLKELNKSLECHFDRVQQRVHCYFGIGIQSSDLNYVPFRFWPQIYASLFLTYLSKLFPGLKKWADSVYVMGFARRKSSGII